jgi:short subunit dehydrogenase-like uncharacterized protein
LRHPYAHATSRGRSMNRFTDKVVLVTGGTSGMGLATARRFTAEGAHVVVTGRSQSRVGATAAELGDPPWAWSPTHPSLPTLMHWWRRSSAATAGWT